jgi:hypothetical protein
MRGRPSLQGLALLATTAAGHGLVLWLCLGPGAQVRADDRVAQADVQPGRPLMLTILAPAPPLPRTPPPALRDEPVPIAQAQVQARPAWSPAVRAEAFLGPREVDKRALPVTEPDAAMLSGMLNTGAPVVLRVYVDAHGDVVAVNALRSLSDDADAVDRIAAMLHATRFLPAKLAGRDVASYVDLEFTFEDVVSSPRPAQVGSSGA